MMDTMGSNLGEHGNRIGRLVARRKVAGVAPRKLRCNSKHLPVLASLGNVLFPPYTKIVAAKEYDLRLYDVYPVIKTGYNSRDEGYLVLGRYMDGQNEKKVRFRETQPLVMRYYPQGSKTMELFVSSVDESQPPLPEDPAAQLDVAGGELLAVMRFEGNATPEVARSVRQKLTAAVVADGFQLADAEADGFFRIAQYGPLYSLTARMNEMMLAIKA